MKKNKTLTGKVIRGVILVVEFMMVILCIGITIRYYFETKSTYKKNAFGLTRTAAEYIDGDTIQKYLDTNEKDEYYENVLKYLRSAQNGANLKYYYVFVPTEDDVIYVWDADNNPGYCELGQHEKYMDEDSKETCKRAFKQNPEERIIINKDEKYGFIASAWSPIFDSSGNPVALVAVDMAMEGFLANLITFLAITIIIVLIASISGAIVLYRYMERNIIDPIDNINAAAKEMVKGLESEESAQIEVNTGDELEELADSFNQMDTEVRDYIEKLKVATAEKQRIGAELDMAKEIQASQLPSIFPAYPERKEFDIYAVMDPAKEVGGDFYDFFFVDDDHLALVMADVSGKGVPAALFMMMSKLHISNYARMGLPPHEVLEKANKAIFENNKRKMFVTVWLGILEISTGKIVASNAGHEYPVIRQPGGEFEILKDKHGFVVGAMKGSKYTDYEFTLQKGGTFFIYTDGAPEAKAESKEMFGMDRLVEALNKDADASPKELLGNVRSAVDEFVGDEPQFDDLTMMGIKLL